MPESIRSIVIVGRDADAWLTARLLVGDLSKLEQSVEVHLVELPSRLTPNDCYSVLPSHKSLVKGLGLDESSLFRTAGAQYVLAQRFVNWSGPGSSYFQPYDSFGINLGHFDFLQTWLRAVDEGVQVSLDQFSLGAVAAQRGKFLTLSEEAEQFSQATYGFHLNALSYLKLIALQALQLGVKHYRSGLASVETNSNHIDAVLLNDGQRLKADLFIDASGGDAALISCLESATNWQSWRPWLRGNRLLSASLPPLSPSSGFSQIVAQPGGWVGIYPLLNRTAMRAVYDSEVSTRQRMMESMAGCAKSSLSNVVEKIICPGVRRDGWIGNCVALGDCSMQTDPLDATDLHWLGLGIATLRSLLPQTTGDMPESVWFNKKMFSFAEHILGFQVAHYQLNGLKGDEFWDRSRQEIAPKNLMRKIQLFKSRGCVAMDEYETFQEENWISLFVGQGLMPDSYDPRVNKIPVVELINKLDQMLSFIAREVEAMPSLESHIEMNSDSYEFGGAF